MKTIDDLPGVFTERGNLYTLSLCPGKRIYGERLVAFDGREYRDWSPRRSKLSAYLTNGGRCFPFKENSNVLYLGASSGTTASHIADICNKGSLICVEISPRMFRDLVSVCETRKNLMPILGDATKPDDYKFVSDEIDIVYQDVAQKYQAKMIADNVDAVGAKFGIVAIKSRSEDVTASPERIFRESKEVLKNRGYKILDSLVLDPYEKDHAMIVFEV
ncbi:MAG TPA: fibrillarin-like rRNA/tRNA 2'-O-methyltransferase [Candidatus Methanomethylophilaceae archaeon]|nr:fibrillarin-like rRNA/tRNA 2'-O-methyltransferase [Candidatus Methanomethylophilaceae archaeon]